MFLYDKPIKQIIFRAFLSFSLTHSNLFEHLVAVFIIIGYSKYLTTSLFIVYRYLFCYANIDYAQN